MDYLYDSFKRGLEQPFRFISQSEAVHDAGLAVSVFASSQSSGSERQVALYGAGRNVGAISDQDLASMFKSIFRKCSQLYDGETIELSASEKSFLKGAINGSFFKPFYE